MFSAWLTWRGGRVVASRSLLVVVAVVLFVADTGHEVWLSISAQVP